MTEKRDARNAVRTLIWEIGAPVIVYYALHLFGASAVLSLAAATAVSLGRTLFVAARDRRLDGFAALMAVMFGIGLALTLITGDPRVALAKDSVMSGVAGAAFLGSCVVGRPLMFAMARRVLPEARQAEADDRWRNDPGYRSRLVVLSLIWGVILLTEALVRIVLVYTLPVDVMVGLSQGLQFAAIGLAVLCSVVYVRQVRREAVPAGAAR
ncbi:VC0807 family protein [Actinoallomurus acaciae]|uniref:VC0807 family protein n=1 Tax=Actinoallomurus acaciae TaxID=502577 RepID=A0ABV5YSV6_9ACTN